MSLSITPGPWTAYNASEEGDTYIGAAGGIIIAQNATEANARAIAAVPELIAALQAVEWTTADPDSSAPLFCPSCEAEKQDGHANGCALAAALRKAGAL